MAQLVIEFWDAARKGVADPAAQKPDAEAVVLGTTLLAHRAFDAAPKAKPLRRPLSLPGSESPTSDSIGGGGSCNPSCGRMGKA